MSGKSNSKNAALMDPLSSKAKSAGTANRPVKTVSSPIILDGVNPKDFRELQFTYCCEQCSHFAPAEQSCTFGYRVDPHLRENQLHLYELKGKMAFCRFLEID